MVDMDAARQAAKRLGAELQANAAQISAVLDQADMSANLGGVTLTPEARRERAKAGNAALTTDQRSAAGKARAAQLHSLASLIDRACKKWPEATDEERRAARAKLRAAGIIR